ncbi:hypothetical protein CAOG_02757 [Capsaspora owczarzaki ATCC 30864]|uniref:hypothetical protein n=1 Tax=Capsaspora owczarzaki (strain ATCC 30864) TaxID=595528 RepID=UPI0001FE4A21|nr:hypothetical protein CAOG_02757 [Capsaspora owczarzaki ATCC 30864]|eukprot:XP_004349507.1 hypothetical protein CAOG_02757 [Capsaspora owczarzaki ATCC 30864]
MQCRFTIIIIMVMVMYVTLLDEPRLLLLAASQLSQQRVQLRVPALLLLQLVCGFPTAITAISSSTGSISTGLDLGHGGHQPHVRVVGLSLGLVLAANLLVAFAHRQELIIIVVIIIIVVVIAIIMVIMIVVVGLCSGVVLVLALVVSVSKTSLSGTCKS